MDPIADVQITLPVERVLDRNVRVVHHIEVRLGARHARVLHRLLGALYRRKVKLGTGRYVDTGADAVRYMLDRLADAAEPADSATGTPLEAFWGPGKSAENGG